jgi:hypothetical protein
VPDGVPTARVWMVKGEKTPKASPGAQLGCLTFQPLVEHQKLGPPGSDLLLWQG